MFEYVGNLKYQDILESTFEIKIEELKKGINLFDNYFVVNEKVIRVYNRKCDHAGGKIITNGNKHLCPIHKWIFDPTKGVYSNGLKKKECKYIIKDNKIILDNIKTIPLITKTNKNVSTKIRFFNHAFLQVEGDNFKFATDPWAVGPAFNTGWWLKKSTKNDWVKELNSCNFIYISHNHPDHLHPQTLENVNKELPIVVPNFISDSTGKYISSLGFKNIFRLELGKEYKLNNSNLYLSILKSGDFREDSGIYFSSGDLTCLFDVDSNIINFNKLPNVDIYASSFAGGASGYPLMFDNYAEEEKKKIIKKETLMIRNFTMNAIKHMKPKYFIPYAGYFEEKLERDKEIKKLNKKNTINDYKELTKKLDVQILDIPKYDYFEFKDNKLINSQNIKKSPYKDLKPKQYLDYFKKNYSIIDHSFIEQYFQNSKFKDNLILIIILTDSKFKKTSLTVLIDFSKSRTLVKKLNKVDIKNLRKKYIHKRILILKCRKESFLHTIYSMNPWEDLLIGFQCKVERYPNIYNAKFWSHFTNVYIKDKDIRKIKSCNGCENINHFFDSKIHNDVKKRKL